jgi:hypothetical protein
LEILQDGFFYYNGLVGGVIQDPNLAGPGGSADNVSSSGNAGNVVALTPFLTSTTGPGFSLQTALTNQGSVSIPVSGALPAF